MIRWSLRTPNIILGLVMMVAGAVIAWPSIEGSFRYRPTTGTLIDVFSEPLADGGNRIQVLYEYTVLPRDRGGIGGEVHVMGWQRSDLAGRLLDDPVVSDAEVSAAIDEILRQNANRTQRVYYEPAEPLSTGRIYLGEGPLELWQQKIGMLLLCTPPVVWSLLIMLHHVARRQANREAP